MEGYTQHNMDLDTLIYLMPESWIITKHAIFCNSRAFEDATPHYGKAGSESFTQMIARAIKAEIEKTYQIK